MTNAFPEPLLAAARQLVHAGAVSELRVLQAGAVVTGIVGTDPARQTKHRVYIRRAAEQDEPRILDAECSCGGDAHCVHVAAVSIAAHDSSHSDGAPQAARRHSQPHAAPVSNEPPLHQRLLYVLCAVDRDRDCELLLSVSIVRCVPGARSLEPQSASAFVGSALAGNDFPRYVDAPDRQILPVLLAQRNEAPWVLHDAAGAALLDRVIATGRATWQTPDGRPLRVGQPRPIRLSWQLLPNGGQRLRCDVDGARALMDLDPPVYVDEATGEVGALTLPCPAAVVRRYFQAPPVAPERVAESNAEIDAAGIALPKLHRFAVQARPLERLAARLRLGAGPSAELHFLYNGLAVHARELVHDAAKIRILTHEGGEPSLEEIDRDLPGERRLRTRFEAVLEGRTRGADFWLELMLRTVPALAAEGWDVEINPAFPYRLATPTEWYVEADPSRDREWFDLKLGTVVDGVSVNLLPALVAHLQGALGHDESGGRVVGRQLFVRLGDGRYLPVPLERIERIAATLVELFEHDALGTRQILELPAAQANRLAELLSEASEPAILRSSDAALVDSIGALRNFTAIRPLEAPPGFTATLRPYQREGLGWLQFLRGCRLGGILADDMGLGKTVQTLAHLSLEKHAGRLRGPSLIVAPVSVIGNWAREIRQLAPALRSLTLHGARRKDSYARIANVDVVVTSYPLLLLDNDVLSAHAYDFLILDEAQFIKNPRAKVSQAARSLRAAHRLCLTGTPMENHLGELWSLADFAQPGLLGDERQFQRHYRTPIEKNEDRERARALSRRIAPFVLRRTKDAVAPELPDKTLILETVALDDKQRDFYDGVRLASHRRVFETIEQRGLARSRITVLDALLKLRQACCDPRLVADGVPACDVPSAKLEWLADALPEMIAEGRRILLFSQFTSMLRLIEAAVRQLGISYLMLTGATRDRAALIEQFQSGAVPLFLISLKAGGTGLNLTAADTVIHYDPWWNPAAEAQATDRAHRIGQDKPVFVYKLIAQGTVEERVVQLQERKHALLSSLYTERNAVPLQWEAADLEMLFAP